MRHEVCVAWLSLGYASRGFVGGRSFVACVKWLRWQCVLSFSCHCPEERVPGPDNLVVSPNLCSEPDLGYIISYDNSRRVPNCDGGCSKHIGPYSTLSDLISHSDLVPKVYWFTTAVIHFYFATILLNFQRLLQSRLFLRADITSLMARRSSRS